MKKMKNKKKGNVMNEFVDFMKQFSDEISILILEYGKYEHFKGQLSKVDFIEYFNIGKNVIEFNGFGSKEFYIKNTKDNVDFTIVVSNFNLCDAEEMDIVN